MKAFPLKRIFIPLITLMVFSALFLCLYRFDNKYTHPATQGINGLLVLSTEDLQQNPIGYLTHGWAFYPGVLLCPADLTGNTPPGYMTYTMIGQHTRFNFGNDNPHGSASYVMNLQLPREAQTYALELPEIFSAYRLFVGGKLLLTIGDPNPAEYTPRTGNRVVTFEAAGRTTILLAVTDHSHFYSGMVYPPAFGTPEAIQSARDLRLWLHVAALVLTLLAGLCALYLGFRMKEQNALIFALLCLAVCGLISYPLLHAALVLPVFPWYALELFCTYGVSLLVIILHNHLCDVSITTKKWSASVAAFICIAALLYGFFSPILTVEIMKTFSILISIFKMATVIYLLLTATFALKTRQEQGWSLFCATIGYAAAFAWDRILPYYEPIYGGWFPEIGSAVLVGAVGYTLWRNVANTYSRSLAFAEEHRQISRQLAMQLEYSHRLAEKTEENRRLVHDFRQHLRTIDGLALDSGNSPIRQYLKQVKQIISSEDDQQHKSFCTNTAADALLSYYYNASKKHGIDMTIRLTLPDNLPLTNVEICTLLGNLLENALDACIRQAQGSLSIAISSLTKGGALFFLVENSYDGMVQMKGERLMSRKSQDGRIGIGLRSVEEIAQRHGGTLDIFPGKAVFRVGVCIPLMK